MHKSDINNIFNIFKNANPLPKTELNYTNNYTLLVAVVLSAQSTDKGVNKATKELFNTISTPQAMIAIGEARLKQHIKTIGLYNSKAKNIIALSKILVEQHNGIIPHSREELEKLPGVGRKTANVVLNVAFNKPTMAVDTHIFRVSNRIGLARANTPLMVEKQLIKVIPKAYLRDAHHWLILHGRYVCKSRGPMCDICKISHLCTYPHKNIAQDI